jgi:hypothetical protein
MNELEAQAQKLLHVLQTGDTGKPRPTIPVKVLEQHIAILGKTGCHRKGQGILMYDGSIKAVEDIVVGERLMGPDSEPRAVVELFRGEQEMARIIPTRGKSFVVNLDHILTLRRTCTNNGNKPDKKRWSIIDVPVKEWLTWPKTRRTHYYKLFHSDGVDFPPCGTPATIEPYFLGILLGDGMLHSRPSVSTPDDGIVALLRLMASKYGIGLRQDKSSGTCPSYTFTVGQKGGVVLNPITEQLRSLGLWGTKAATKFIPQHYKVASRTNRLELLAGLIDTDGHLSRGCYDFISKSKRLAEDVAFLCRSVGLCVQIVEKFCKAQTGAGGIYHRLSISGHTSMIPCRIEYKHASPRLQKKDALKSGFEIEQLPVEKFWGFALDGDGRYLLDDFTVTHNSGKTYTAKGIAESLLAENRRVCILDPTGVWWGLRSDITGKKPAFSIFVLGGKHGDLPLDSHTGTAIAEIIGKTHTSAIIDTRRFTISERTRFYTDFAETLLQVNEGPLHVIIDEAHLMMPQGRVSDPQSAKMLNAGNNMVSLGRGVGLRIIMISQRPAKLHKDGLTQSECLIALRLIAPQDRNAVEDWIGEWADPKQGKELLSSLASLPTGTGWIWAPEIGLLERVTFPRISTYDSSKAPDGASRQIVLAPIDLPAIQERLQVVAKEVLENDPKKLRARIAELERLAKSALGQPPTVVEKPVMSEADFDRFANTVNNLRTILSNTLEEINKAVAPGRPIPLKSGVQEIETEFRRVKGMPPLPMKVAPRLGITVTPQNGSSEIGKSGLRRMLIALAQNPQGLTDSKLGLRADVSVKGGSFDTYLSKARRSGWVDGDRQSLKITRAGLEALGHWEPLPKGKDLLNHWIRKMGTGGASRMLLALSNLYPLSCTAQHLGITAGVSVDGGSFDTYLSRLRGFDLITGDRTALRASEEFFT